MKKKKVYSALFLDVEFDKVWQSGLNNKIKPIIPDKYCQLLESYLQDKTFRCSILKEIPQVSVLGPIFYLILHTRYSTKQ